MIWAVFRHNWQKLMQTRPLRFALFAANHFLDMRVPQIAGSLTHTTLLALVPLITVMLAALTAFPVFGDMSESFMAFVNATIVPSGASAVSAYLQQFKDHAASLSSISLVIMVITCMMLVQTIDETFNRIWGVTRPRSLMTRVLVYWALLTIGPAVVAFSISLSAYTLRLQALQQLPHFAGSLKLAGQLVFETLLFAAAFRIVPNCYVALKHAFIGAFVTAALIEAAKWGFGLYIRNFNSYETIYGAFAAIPVFLVWLQLLWMIVLSGAVLTACLSHWHEGVGRQSDRSGLLFDDAIAVLTALSQAQQQGRIMQERDFRLHLAMGGDQIGSLLDSLDQHGYIERSRNGWLLKTTPDNIILRDLFALYVYNPDHQPHSPGSLIKPCLTALNISLAEYINQQAQS